MQVRVRLATTAATTKVAFGRWWWLYWGYTTVYSTYASNAIAVLEVRYGLRGRFGLRISSFNLTAWIAVSSSSILLYSREISNQDVVDLKLPDFPRLVNFPDYLAKGQARGGGGGGGGSGNDKAGSTAEGKRHCVMCGKLRISSSITAGRQHNIRGATSSVKQLDDADNTNNGRASSGGDSSSTTVHIIPRQNKGVCTACDVTVWMIVGDPGREDQASSLSSKISMTTTTTGKQQRQPSPHAYSNLEIKWCKGCKNFRPWAAFGEKGLATKCVRCRHRQREKYALQKNESRCARDHQQEPAPSASSRKNTAATKGKRSIPATSASPTSPLPSYMNEKKEDDILAAQSLNNLMRCGEVEI